MRFLVVRCGGPEAECTASISIAQFLLLFKCFFAFFLIFRRILWESSCIALSLW